MSSRFISITLLLCLVWVGACSEGGRPCDSPAKTEPAAFVEVAQAWGVNFAPNTPQAAELMRWYGNGVCLIDYDLDGDQDLYVLDELEEPNRLFENRGGSFSEIEGAAGANTTALSKSCLSFDYDADGDYDLYVGTTTSDILYQNNDGVFVDVTASVGIKSENVTVMITAGDIEGDGDLDLVVAGFVNYPNCDEGLQRLVHEPLPEDDENSEMTLTHKICDPVDPEVYLFEDGVYQKGSGHGIVDAKWILAGLLLDIDFDGDLDLFLGSDWQQDPSYLFINDGTGHFENQAQAWGIQWLNDPETGPSAMGLSFADLDQDDVYDIAISNWRQNPTVVFDCAPTETGSFCQDASLFHGQGTTFSLTSWGMQFGDYNQDFKPDLFVANGALKGVAGEKNQLFLNTDGQLVEFTHPEFDELFLMSRAANRGDLDGDGDLDLVITSVNQPLQILENRVASGNYLLIELDTQSAGATIRATTSKGTLRKFAYTGGSYLGSDDPRVHFGLGDACTVDLEVRWIGGATKTLTNVGVNQVLRIERP